MPNHSPVDIYQIMLTYKYLPVSYAAGLECQQALTFEHVYGKSGPV